MLEREIRHLYLQKENLIVSLGFFVLALFCVFLALGPEEKILRRSAPALIWILAILTTLFSTPLFLKHEAQQGLLDEIALQPFLPAFLLLSKIGAEFLLLGIPIIIVGMILSPFFVFSFHETLMLALTLLIGFPSLSALGILGGLLTVNSRGGGVLVSLLILPLTLPLVLFSLACLEMVQLGLDSLAPFCLLIGVSLLLIIISVSTGSWAFRFAIEE